MSPLTLNVLIHGMYVIDFGDHDVTLYAPDVPHCAHVYRAGTWMQEQDLSRMPAPTARHLPPSSPIKTPSFPTAP